MQLYPQYQNRYQQEPVYFQYLHQPEYQKNEKQNINFAYKQTQNSPSPYNNQYNNLQNNVANLNQDCINAYNQQLQQQNLTQQTKAVIQYIIKYYTNAGLANTKLKINDNTITDIIKAFKKENVYRDDNFNFSFQQKDKYGRPIEIDCYFTASKNGNLKLRVGMKEYGAKEFKGSFKKVVPLQQIHKFRSDARKIMKIEVQQNKSSQEKQMEIKAFQANEKMLQQYPDLAKYFVKNDYTAKNNSYLDNLVGYQKDGGRDLDGLIKERKLTTKQMDAIASQTIDAVKILLKYNLHNGDLKPANIVFDSNKNKITVIDANLTENRKTLMRGKAISPLYCDFQNPKFSDILASLVTVCNLYGKEAFPILVSYFKEQSNWRDPKDAVPFLDKVQHFVQNHIKNKQNLVNNTNCLDRTDFNTMQEQYMVGDSQKASYYKRQFTNNNLDMDAVINSQNNQRPKTAKPSPKLADQGFFDNVINAIDKIFSSNGGKNNNNQNNQPPKVVQKNEIFNNNVVRAVGINEHKQKQHYVTPPTPKINIQNANIDVNQANNNNNNQNNHPQARQKKKIFDNNVGGVWAGVSNAQFFNVNNLNQNPERPLQNKPRKPIFDGANYVKPQVEQRQQIVNHNVAEVPYKKNIANNLQNNVNQKHSNGSSNTTADSLNSSPHLNKIFNNANNADQIQAKLNIKNPNFTPTQPIIYNNYAGYNVNHGLQQNQAQNVNHGLQQNNQYFKNQVQQQQNQVQNQQGNRNFSK